MNVGLLDIDGHNYPNLALMKLSAFHKSRGDRVEFATMFEHYNIIYKSKVFTWTPDNEYAYNTDATMAGGTGYGFIDLWLNDEVDSMCPDYGLYDCQHAYGFLTRGCIRKCPWCFVPEKEGDIFPYSDIDDFLSGFSSAVLMDNNVLAHEHGIRQIEKIIKKKIRIDFNQGLDARLIDDSIARMLSRVKWISGIRLACDTESSIDPVRKAIEALRWENYNGPISVYVLVKDVDEAIKRIRFLKGMKVDPFAQAYRDKAGNTPTEDQKRLARWVDHKAIFKSVKWSEYR
ncbi:MAG: radical SAM protein [Phycisphaerae bacterium]|jgi:hypothetical protein